MTDLTSREKSDRITIDVLTHKTEELESKVIAMPDLEERAEQLLQDKVSFQHKADGLQGELSKYKDLLDSTKARIADLSQERERAVQQAQETASKDIEQFRQFHRLELDKASTEADKRVLESIAKARDEYISKLDSLAQKNDRNQEKNDVLVARNQELTERIHLLELQKKDQRPVNNTPVEFNK
jgi:serine/threonine-protein kinase RIO1